MGSPQRNPDDPDALEDLEDPLEQTQPNKSLGITLGDSKANLLESAINPEETLEDINNKSHLSLMDQNNSSTDLTTHRDSFSGVRKGSAKGKAATGLIKPP